MNGFSHLGRGKGTGADLRDDGRFRSLTRKVVRVGDGSLGFGFTLLFDFGC